MSLLNVISSRLDRKRTVVLHQGCVYAIMEISACDLFLSGHVRQKKQLSQRAGAAQEWHKPTVIDVLHCMCAPLLRPTVTHQSSGHAQGKYEVTDRSSGRAAATGISLSHTDRLLLPCQIPLAVTSLLCQRQSAGETGRCKSPVAESVGDSG